jgi:hypothetical protein
MTLRSGHFSFLHRRMESGERKRRDPLADGLEAIEQHRPPFPERELHLTRVFPQVTG